MGARTLRVPQSVGESIRALHPELRRKVRAALDEILDDPGCGKALKDELGGLWSLRVGAHRVIYRMLAGVCEIVAVGPRRTIYEEAARIAYKERKSSDR